MERHDDGGSAVRALTVAAVALAGFFFSLTPPAERIEQALLDAEWRTLRRFDQRPAADDIAIVGIDDATLRAVPEPPALWHATLGRMLQKLAAQKPRAIVLDLPLPERSYDGVKPGLDRALYEGLADAIDSAPLVAVLPIDARTRGVRPIHLPYLALLGESRLGLNLLARDADGVARRYALLVPTEDGGFPTLEGRLCRNLERDCGEGLIHFALGRPYTYVPLQNLLAMEDAVLLRRLFHDRIVLVGETRPFADRVEVPLNLAAWEDAGATSPGVVVRAQTLRTALAGAAPREASRPLVVLLLSLAALLALLRDWRLAAVIALVVAAAGALAAMVALRNGVHVPLAPVAFTLALALAARALAARRRRRPVSDIPQSR